MKAALAVDTFNGKSCFGRMGLGSANTAGPSAELVRVTVERESGAG